MVGKVVLKAADVLKRLKSRSKTPSKTTTSKEAKLVEGAGEMSDPPVGRYRAGQGQRRGGATKTATQAMSTTEKAKLARQRAAKGSLERAKKLKPGSIEQLQDEFQKLEQGAKRAEQLKGSKSKYYKVFKVRGMTPVATSEKASTALGLKKPVKKSKLKRTGLRSKLQGKSIKEIEESFKSYDIEDMLRKLKQAGTPDKTLINKLTKIQKKEDAKWKDIRKRNKAKRKEREASSDEPTAWDKLSMKEKYEAEFPRSPQGKFKKRSKKGGRITYRMTGGQVVSHGYD